MVKGGCRPVLGRPRAHQYGEQIEQIYTINNKDIIYGLPFYVSAVQAGFPSPADDYIEQHLDLNEHLISHPASTFIVRASGDSMRDAGIADGDLLIVDRSLEATAGNIVIAAVLGELTVKRLSQYNGHLQLLPANPKYPPIDISEEQDLVIWGVVTYVIHKARHHVRAHRL